ncbi:MAG: glucose-6-phosphate dehydrogenase assembly protein OpcA [Bacteroidota bacterium]
MPRVDSFTRGIPINVDVSSIDRELSTLWKSAADAVEGDTASAVMRACTANVIMYTEDEDAAERYPSMVQEITVERPARVILVIGDPSSLESSLDAWISAHCHVPVPGGKQVCSEQITLLAHGEGVRAVPNLVLSLLVPDEPVILRLDGNILNRKEIFQRPLRVTDHLVFDSAHFEKPAEDLAELWELMRKSRERPSVRPVSFGDLNWSRLLDWRELTAEFFDSPSSREYISRIISIHVTYEDAASSKASGLTQAMLYVGWLAARLGWKIDSGLKRIEDGTLSVQMNRGEFPIEAHLTPVSPIDRVANDILSVAIRADAAAPAHFSAVRSDDALRVETFLQIPGLQEIRRTAEMRNRTEAQLFGEQIEVFSFDRCYEEALAVAGQIARRGS